MLKPRRAAKTRDLENDLVPQFRYPLEQSTRLREKGRTIGVGLRKRTKGFTPGAGEFRRQKHFSFWTKLTKSIVKELRVAQPEIFGGNGGIAGREGHLRVRQ